MASKKRTALRLVSSDVPSTWDWAKAAPFWLLMMHPLFLLMTGISVYSSVSESRLENSKK